MGDKNRKKLFILTAAINFILVTIYEFITPRMSDDIIYGDVVSGANSFADLFVQEYDHYLNHIGRSVAHIILRIFLYIGNKGVFNVAAGAVFTLLSILIYLNIRDRKEYDVRIYLLILLMMWLFDPAISNTVFWETGACNYMFTATIIFGYITLFRKAYISGEKKSVAFAGGMFIFGILSGWCNENASGGMIFMVLVLMLVSFLEKKNLSGIKSWMVTGLIGNIIGFVLMILSPGNFSRAAGADEEHTGLMALVARFLKITLNIKNSYLVLICVFALILVTVAYREKNFERFKASSKDMLLFGVMFIVTVYALIAVPDSQLRTYYCASLFLMTAIAEGFAWAGNKTYKEDMGQIFITGIVTVLTMFFVFTYIAEGANLSRINREFAERDAYLEEMSNGEEMVVEVPMLRPQWESRYSMAYVSDITEDKFNWLNLAYAEHYGLWYIIGVDRESWTEY